MTEKMTAEQLDAYYARYTCPVCLKNCTSLCLLDVLNQASTLRYICEYCGLVHHHKP